MWCLYTDERDVILDTDELYLQRAFRKERTCDYGEFSKKWQRGKRARRAREQAGQEKESGGAALLPVEKAARGSERPRFLDRMPCRARADPLTIPNFAPAFDFTLPIFSRTAHPPTSCWVVVSLHITTWVAVRQSCYEPPKNE